MILLVVACEKPKATNPIVGAWTHSNTSLVSSDTTKNYSIMCVDTCMTITFKPDLTYMKSNGTYGTYVMDGDHVKLGDSTPAVFTINEGTLTLVWRSKADWNWSVLTQTYIRNR